MALEFEEKLNKTKQAEEYLKELVEALKSEDYPNSMARKSTCRNPVGELLRFPQRYSTQKVKGLDAQNGVTNEAKLFRTRLEKRILPILEARTKQGEVTEAAKSTLQQEEERDPNSPAIPLLRSAVENNLATFYQPIRPMLPRVLTLHELNQGEDIEVVEDGINVVEIGRPINFDLMQELSLYDKAGGELVKSFLASSHFSNFLSIAQRFYQNPDYRLDEEEFINTFIGFMMEQIAYPYTQRYLQKEYHNFPLVVLSPEDCLALFRIAYPDKPIVNHLDINQSVQGITVLDGIIVRQYQRKVLTIQGYCEYFISNKLSEGKRKQIDILQNQRPMFANALRRALTNTHPDTQETGYQLIIKRFGDIPKGTTIIVDQPDRLHVFYTRVLGADPIPGVKQDHIIPLNINAGSLAHTAKAILVEVKEQTERGMLIEPAVFLPEESSSQAVA